jgi:hypothetical protein
MTLPAPAHEQALCPILSRFFISAPPRELRVSALSFYPDSFQPEALQFSFIVRLGAPR